MERMKPNPFMDKNIQGVNQVISGKGDYAFIMESTLIEYNVAKECGLAQLGTQIYAIKFSCRLSSEL